MLSVSYQTKPVRVKVNTCKYIIIVEYVLLGNKQMEFVKIYDVSCRYPQINTSSYKDFIKSKDVFMTIIINCPHLHPVKVSLFVISTL